MAQAPEDRRRLATTSAGGGQGKARGDTVAKPAAFGPNSTAFSPFGDRSERMRQLRPELSMTITRDGRTYREVDNGIANVLVPTLDASTSPANIAANRAAIDRAFYMANNTFAGVAYGAATLAGRPPAQRDQAMAIGGAVDSALDLAVPRLSTTAARGPVRRSVPQDLRDGGIRYRKANAANQSQGVNAALSAPMLGTGGRTRSSVKPPGFVSGKAPYNHDRAHTLAKRLGGTADRVEEVFAATRRLNSPTMSNYERALAQRIASGELIDYSLTPHYAPGSEAPHYVTLAAFGDRGPPMAVIMENPLGRPKK